MGRTLNGYHGRLVHDHWKESGAEPRRAIVPVKLTKDLNDLMLRTCKGIASGKVAVSLRETRLHLAERDGYFHGQEGEVVTLQVLRMVDQQGGRVGACRIRQPDGTALEGLEIQPQ